MSETELVKVKKTYDDNKSLFFGVSRKFTDLVSLLLNASPQKIINFAIGAGNTGNDPDQPAFVIEWCPDTSGADVNFSCRMRLKDLIAINQTPLDIKFREIQVCQGGETKKMVILCSDTYT